MDEEPLKLLDLSCPDCSKLLMTIRQRGPIPSGGVTLTCFDCGHAFDVSRATVRQKMDDATHSAGERQ